MECQQKFKGKMGIKWTGPSEGRLANEEVITQKEDEEVEEDADMGQKGIAAAGAGR
jgi:hypothetical protein